MNTFQTALEYFLFITLELTVLFLGISTLVAYLLLHVPPERLRSWLSRRGVWGNVLGAVAGSLTPFCACSTIPMTRGLLDAGIPFGPVMSFVIASPLLNPIIIGMIVALMGSGAALLYFVVTFLGSIVFGVVLDAMGGARLVRIRQRTSSCCCKPNAATPEGAPASHVEKLRASLRTAWRDYQDVLPYLLVGVAIGAVIYGYVPADLVVSLAGPGSPAAIPVAATIGVPLYIRAETALPIGMVLAGKGMSLGAVIALVIGGAGMAIPEMAMLASIFERRLVAAIVVSIWLTAVGSGYLFNLLL